MAKEITTANFETEVLKSEKPVLTITWIPICSIRYKTRAGLWSFFAAEAITLRVKARILSF